jgi:hypothetical protein
LRVILTLSLALDMKLEKPDSEFIRMMAHLSEEQFQNYVQTVQQSTLSEEHKRTILDCMHGVYKFSKKIMDFE